MTLLQPTFRGVLLVLLLPLGGLFLMAGTPSTQDKPKSPEVVPPEIVVSQPVAREITDYADFTGRFDAVQSVDLRARVSGYLDKVHFKEGAEVKKGDLLFEIDPRPYQAQVDQAMSRAKLNEASLKLAKLTLERDLAIAKAVKDGLNQQQLDLDKTAVEEAEARLAASKAVVEVHKLTLEFTKIRSPIDGQIGRCHQTPGNLVVRDQTLLASVLSRDPIYVYFEVDERTLLKVKPLVDKEPPVLVGLAPEAGYPRKGKVNFTDCRVNSETGTVSMRAMLANPDKLLLPGMFARVRLPLGAPDKALLVPDEAVRLLIDDQGQRRTVYVVDAQDKVAFRPVIIGQLQDGFRVIEKGLKAEERVILKGQDRVESGMTVKPIKEDAKPKESKP